ncbi:MAG: DUF1697 domain-containing protein [Bryobacteraceae bacterium]|jgi:uncharacterized protein (DUF1697 family)
MAIVIGLLRGINVGGHHKVGMAALRSLCESLGLRDVQTLLQSGNVVFRTEKRDLGRLRGVLEKAIEGEFGFHSDVVLRTAAEVREAADRNPFAARPGMDPSRLAVHFLAAAPSAEAVAQARAIPCEPEELCVSGQELFVYYTNGMARPKLSMPLVERTLKTSGTSRNWNTVRKLLEMAEKMEE